MLNELEKTFVSKNSIKNKFKLWRIPPDLGVYNHKDYQLKVVSDLRKLINYELKTKKKRDFKHIFESLKV